MEINKLIDDVLNNDKKEDQQQEIYKLLSGDLFDDNNIISIYNHFKNDIELYINDFLKTSKDINAAAGMYKCSLETWQACITNIGLYYFRKNKYLYDTKKNAAAGGVALSDDLLSIGLELYEYFCYEYKKQFFIYDCCRFLGISKDLIYKLSDLHADLLKKAHTIQEASLRAGLASGRSNVTALAILLNHDYNYTKTTEIIHHSSGDKSADQLPDLDKNTIYIDEKM